MSGEWERWRAGVSRIALAIRLWNHSGMSHSFLSSLCRSSVMLLGAPFLFGCTHTSVIPLAADTIQVTASAAPVCGGAGAEGAAIRYAAVEVLKFGYDRFIIQGQQATDTVRVIGYTPAFATTNSSATAYGSNGMVNASGYSTTTVNGGAPIIGGHHGDTLIVKMFRDDDPAGANAVSARSFLGPDWQKALSGGSRGTCF